MVLLVCTLMAKDANAKLISYGAMGRDGNRGCGPTNPAGCKKQEANKYSRGCKKEFRCRGDKT
uniref:Uncharacterized protein n=1 Tax=Manihot esculenta TaxID=3983 RepID=A0A2C9V611_MANES